MLRCAVPPALRSRCYCLVFQARRFPFAFSIQLHLLLHHLPALNRFNHRQRRPAIALPASPPNRRLTTAATRFCACHPLSRIRLAPRRISSSDPPSLAPYRLRQRKKTLKAPAAPLLSPTRDLFLCAGIAVNHRQSARDPSPGIPSRRYECMTPPA